METPWIILRSRFSRIVVMVQILLGVLTVLISVATLHRFYSAGLLIPNKDADACSQSFHTDLKEPGFADFDLKSLSDRVGDVVSQLSELQDKLEATIHKMDKEKRDKAAARPNNMTQSEFRTFLQEEVIEPLYSAHIALRQIRIPKKPDDDDDSGAGLLHPAEDPLINFFTVEETRKYITAKGNKNGRLSIYRTNKTYNAIGHACDRPKNRYMAFESPSAGTISCRRMRSRLEKPGYVCGRESRQSPPSRWSVSWRYIARLHGFRFLCTQTSAVDGTLLL